MTSADLHYTNPDQKIQRKQWKQILVCLSRGEELSSQQSRWAIEQIILGQATTAQIAAFALGMKMKGPTTQELVDLSEMMLTHSYHLDSHLNSQRIIDIVGTGGDGMNTVNISTMAALIVAATGIPVIKYGNRSAGSRSGGADILEALGICIDLDYDAIIQCIQHLGIAFCFAPRVSPSYRHAAQVRQEIGAPTIFNLLGPLTNPSRPQAMLLGCAFADLAPTVAQVCAQRGCDALVVHNHDGLDELAPTAPATIWTVHDGHIERVHFDPSHFGFPRISLDHLIGGDARYNATIARALVEGQPGPIRDTVILNAAGALIAYRGITPGPQWDNAWREAITQVSTAIDRGSASTLLQNWASFSQHLCPSSL